MTMPSALNTAMHQPVRDLMHALAAVQPAEGIRIEADTLGATWVWVQCFADFDYEYAWLLDVRLHHEGSNTTESDYLAVYEGYDNHGQAAYRATWWGHPETFPKVPDLYSALSWWAEWVKNTRTGEHGESA
jgi:hypothetical protein